MISRAAVILAAVAVSACTPPARDDRAADNESPAAQTPAADDNAANEAAPANASEQSRSILRPDVIKPEPVEPTLRPVEIVVPFGTDGAALDEAAKRSLDEILASPTTKAGGPVVVRGHTDSRGTDRDNLAASRRRATLVRDYLEKAGVDRDRMTVVALGETRPIAPNANADGTDDPAGRARNRRVEVSVALPVAPPPVMPTTPRD